MSRVGRASSIGISALAAPIPSRLCPRTQRSYAAAPPPQRSSERGGRGAPSAAERTEWASDGPCAPLTGGAQRVSGRASVASALAGDASAAPVHDELRHEPMQASSHAQPSVPLAAQVRTQQPHRELNPDNEADQQVITAVQGWGKPTAPLLTHMLTSQAIVSGLSSPTALPALGLSKPLRQLLQSGHVQTQLQAELEHAGVASNVAQQVADAVTADELLQRALAAGDDDWKLPGAPDSWRKGLRRMRMWFIEVTIYRIAAKLGVQQPSLQGTATALLQVPRLQPGSLQEGLEGQRVAAEHLASVLAAASTTAWTGFGRIADGISTTCGKHDSFETSVPGVRFSRCRARYRKPEPQSSVRGATPACAPAGAARGGIQARGASASRQPAQDAQRAEHSGLRSAAASDQDASHARAADGPAACQMAGTSQPQKRRRSERALKPSAKWCRRANSGSESERSCGVAAAAPSRAAGAGGDACD